MKMYAAMLAFFLIGAGPAVAGTIENAFGNTITVTGPDGRAARYHFNADGTFAAFMPDGTALSGQWRKLNGEICLSAPDMPEEDCTPYDDEKALGDTWAATVGGASYTLAIVAGR